ncbi:hypothetical protein B0J11DRAFT_606634 [Dendryphion nanum]|uniref:Peptidase metallopeptidase domain-containing protein n=1 Tax=Dendryphion nanum TaxID=256645 RepID=A0A9P9DQS1_9PLEO|nr:hypothetical protein B0J11DRAFT_606634 [Dendryphion nanum]
MSSKNHTIGKYPCHTQEGDEPSIGPTIATRLPKGKHQTDELVLGFGNIVPRWAVIGGNTELQYYVKTDSFPSPAEAKIAGENLQKAAKEWNEIKFGITISQSPTKKDAHFDLVYQKNGVGSERTLARAFFPHEKEQDVIVFELAFKNPTMIKDIFLHELGHVLGLRHEFAITIEGRGAVNFGEKNPKSVMSYTFPPEIQKSDKEGIKAFYKEKNGHLIGTQPITDYTPTPRKIV